MNAGDRIRWAAGRGSYHLASECVASQPGEVITLVPTTVVVSTELRASADPTPTRVVCANNLPDTDGMLAAFGVKS